LLGPFEEPSKKVFKNYAPGLRWKGSGDSPGTLKRKRDDAAESYLWQHNAKRAKTEYDLIDVVSFDLNDNALQSPCLTLKHDFAAPQPRLPAKFKKTSTPVDRPKPKCTHIGCDFTPQLRRKNASSPSAWRDLVRQVVSHERDLAAHTVHVATHKDVCGCCQMLLRTGAWENSHFQNSHSVRQAPRVETFESSDSLSEDEHSDFEDYEDDDYLEPHRPKPTVVRNHNRAPARNNKGNPAPPVDDVVCSHVGCGFLSRAGSYHNRKNNVRFHEKNLRLHVDHVRHSLEHNDCPMCRDLMSSGTWGERDVSALCM
jgi:hypothetical protein